MAFCGNCGKKIEDGQKFCPFCGTQQVSADSPTTGYSSSAQTQFQPRTTTRTNPVNPSTNGISPALSQDILWSIVSMVMLILNAILICAKNFKLNADDFWLSDYIQTKYTAAGLIDVYQRFEESSAGLSFFKFLLYLAPFLTVAAAVFIAYNAFFKKKGIDTPQMIAAGVSTVYSFIIYAIFAIVLFSALSEEIGSGVMSLGFFGWIFFFESIATILVVIVAKSKGGSSSRRAAAVPSASSNSGAGSRL